MSIGGTRLTALITGAFALTSVLTMCAGSAPTADIGECFNLDDLGQEEVTEIPTVDCGDEHDAQFYAKTDLEQDDFPGLSTVETEADEYCLGEFEGYVGAPVEEADPLFYGYLAPTEDSWNQGDREVLCIAFLTDGSTHTGGFEGYGS